MGRKLLLEHDNKPGIQGLEGYRANGGYRSVEKALKTMSPDAVLEEVKKSGLRGRGGAGFPTGLKWSFMAKPPGVPRYLVVGMITSSFALGANTSYIYIRGEYFYIYRILERAIEEARAAGWLGKNILGSGFDHDIHVQVGAGAYICGEETALLESLEGKRGNPRIKPPFPAVKGLYDCPTVVNNVETIAAVVPIINDGGDEYAKIGVGKSTGTKLISAGGNIRKPGVYEIELGITCEEFLNSDEWCGGVEGRALKAVVPGGSSVPIIPAELYFKTAKFEPRLMTYESLSDGGFATGSMLGSGGFYAYNDAQCIVRSTWNHARFYAHESCGQCSPCREGTGWMEKILYRLEHGQGRTDDIDLLWDIQRKIEGNTICPLGDAAAWPVASAIRHFRDEFEYHATHPTKVKDPKHFEKEPFKRIPKFASA